MPSSPLVRIGLAITCVGLVFIGYAGMLKEKDEQKLAAAGSLQAGLLADGPGGGAEKAKGGGKGGFLFGLVLCLASGIFSPMLNFSLSFGGEIKQLALNQVLPPAHPPPPRPSAALRPSCSKVLMVSAPPPPCRRPPSWPSRPAQPPGPPPAGWLRSRPAAVWSRRSWLTAAIPVESPCCSCKANRMEPQPTFANNAVWVIGVGAGFVVNCIYCCYLLTVNQNWSAKQPPSATTPAPPATAPPRTPSHRLAPHRLAPAACASSLRNPEPILRHDLRPLLARPLARRWPCPRPGGGGAKVEG